jgi:chemotaxis protein MotB
MPSRWLVSVCLIPALFGCVSLTYYEALREAYERSEARTQVVQNELARTAAELARVERDLAQLKTDASSRGSGAEARLLKENAELLSRMESMRSTLNATQQDTALLRRQLDTAKSALAAKDEEMGKALRALEASLKEEIAGGSGSVKRVDNTVTVMLVERILYDSGSAEITTEGLKVLRRVAEALKASPRTDIRVEGHTDDVPIRSEPPPRFSTNFELSVARAVGVVRYLKEVAGVRASRLSAMGFAGTRPLVSNVNDEARSRNRRVEIIVTPQR